jgi:hypothetical protein
MLMVSEPHARTVRTRSVDSTSHILPGACSEVRCCCPAHALGAHFVDEDHACLAIYTKMVSDRRLCFHVPISTARRAGRFPQIVCGHATSAPNSATLGLAAIAAERGGGLETTVTVTTVAIREPVCVTRVYNSACAILVLASEHILATTCGRRQRTA